MKISEEEINIIISQTEAPRDKVKKYLYHNKGDIINSLIDHNCLGVDRVVPIGRAHAMDNIWDGYDIINSMSRIISV